MSIVHQGTEMRGERPSEAADLLCDCGHHMGSHVVLQRGLACVVPGCRCGGGRVLALREFGSAPRPRRHARRELPEFRGGRALRS